MSDSDSDNEYPTYANYQSLLILNSEVSNHINEKIDKLTRKIIQLRQEQCQLKENRVMLMSKYYQCVCGSRVRVGYKETHETSLKHVVKSHKRMREMKEKENHE